MYDFDKRREEFRSRRKEFDRRFESARKWAAVGSAILLSIAAALIGFVIWVVAMVMRFFGVV